jgi:hypothetical protein
MLVLSGSFLMEASMTHYGWQFGLIIIIVVALGARISSQQQHSQIVAPAIAGDSVIVQTTSGHVVLIDTGNDAPKLLEFIGAYRRRIHTGVVDTIVITQSGAAWQGALNALIMRGATHIIWLPASHTDGAVVCQTHAISCTFATIDNQWRIDDITFQVAGLHSVWVVWPSGQLLVAHSGIESVHVPTTNPVTGVIYPWRIEPPLDFHHHAQLSFVLYSDGMHPKHAARRSMAQRRISTERLLHEDIDGDMYITLSNPIRIERTVAP